MGKVTTDRGRAPLGEPEREHLRSWVDDDGEPAVLEEIGISRLALARSVGGMRVLAGTREMVVAALARRAA